MAQTIEIPLWLAMLVGVLGIAGLLDRIIGPGLRWMFRKRVNRAIDELNNRLQLKIQPFKLTKRQVLIDRLTHDPKVMQAVEDYVAAEGVPREVAVETVERYARDTVPAFSTFAYFGLGTRAARFVCQALYRVRLGYLDETALRAIDPESTVVFVMNHRSNVDYMLVTYLASGQSALSYAVGEWAQIWGLSTLIRSMGAYFVRRKSNNPLYRKVLARYVQMATEGGVAQAMFPEGGLSRDGRLRPTKLGLLAYMTEDFTPGISRDVVFIPVGLNYDRVLEDRVLLSEERGAGEPEFRFGIAATGGFALRHLWLRLTGRFHRFGYACVSFGAPLSLAKFVEAAPLDVAALGDELMRRVGAVVPVLPVSAVATVLLDAEGPLSEIEIKARVLALLEAFQAHGAHVHIPRGDQDYAVEVGLRMLRLRRITVEEDGLIAANPAEMRLLAYYANAIAHLAHAPEQPV